MSYQKSDISVQKGEVCSYCGYGERPDSPHLDLYGFCSCSSRMHIHCMAWYVMTTRQTVCDRCQSPYKNYRMRPIDRGTRAYDWRDTCADRTSILGIRIPLTLILWLISICFQLLNIFNSWAQMRQSHIYAQFIGRVGRTALPYKDPEQWLIVLKHLFQILISLYDMFVGEHRTYRSYMGQYIIFNSYNQQNDDQLVAYHLTETERMVERWRDGNEPRLKQWFDRQKVNDRSVKYEEYDKFDPVPKGHFASFWWYLKNWLWGQRFN